MRFSTVISGATLFHLSIAGYVLEDDYMNDFFGNFDYFTDRDPTEGFVKYVDRATAEETGLMNSTYATSGTGAVSWGVDHTNVTPEGRPSIRMTSKKSYNSGLVVIDVEHMPVGCGTWPAFWMLGPDWPDKGEIDIIEGVNEQDVNSMTLHTGPNCAITGSSGGYGAFDGEMVTDDCHAYAPDQDTNAGCSIEHPSKKSFGVGLNENKGGVYATHWTKEYISVYFFPRGEIPEDVLGDSPIPSSWGIPAARFAGKCDIGESIQDQQLVFTTTFCGVWAGAVWEEGSCAKKAETCEEWVRDNPEAFAETFWTINALKVYKEDEKSPVPPNSSYSTMSSPQVGVPSATVAPPLNGTASVPTLTTTQTVVETAIPTSEAPSLTSSLAPAISFTSQYSALEPSAMIPSSELVSSTAESSAASPTTAVSSTSAPAVTVAPPPSNGTNNGRMQDGFNWPGASDNNDSDTAGAAPTRSTLTSYTLPSNVTATGLAVAVKTATESAAPTEPSAVPAPEPTGDRGERESGKAMPGFQWPSGGGQSKPGNSTTTAAAPVVTSSTASEPAPIETDAPSSPASPDSPASTLTATVSAPAEPSSSKTCTMSMTVTASETKIAIPLPTGGRTETFLETVYVTVDSFAKETEVPTPGLRRARVKRQQRRRITRHHAKASNE